MVARRAHNPKVVGSNPTSRNHLWFTKEHFRSTPTSVGTATTAGFMSLNKPGDRDKALVLYNGPCDL